MGSSAGSESVQCLGGLGRLQERSRDSFCRRDCHDWTMVSGGGGGGGFKWAVPEVSFKGMFNFHSLFLKSNFLQRHEE